MALGSGYQEGWSLEDGIVKRGHFSVIQIVGARAVVGERSAFAFNDNLSMASIARVVQTTRVVTQENHDGHVAADVRRRARRI